MKLIDADKFLTYLIYSKHIDGLTCGEVKEAIEMCKVDVLDKIRAEITEYKDDQIIHAERNEMIDIVLEIIDKYREGSEYGHMD